MTRHSICSTASNDSFATRAEPFIGSPTFSALMATASGCGCLRGRRRRVVTTGTRTGRSSLALFVPSVGSGGPLSLFFDAKRTSLGSGRHSEGRPVHDSPRDPLRQTHTNVVEDRLKQFFIDAQLGSEFLLRHADVRRD